MKLFYKDDYRPELWLGNKLLYSTLLEDELRSEFNVTTTKQDRWVKLRTDTNKVLDIHIENLKNHYSGEYYLTDWGDGTKDNLIEHTYAEPGNYIIKTHYVDVECNIYSYITNITLKVNYSIFKEKIFNTFLTTNYTLSQLHSLLGYDLTIDDTTSFFNVEKGLRYFPKFGSNSYNRAKSINVENIKINNMDNLQSVFMTCMSLENIVGLSLWDTSNITDMRYMFSSCTSLTSLDLSNWNTDKVTSTYYMFYNCTSLTSLNLSTWNTSKVNDMGWMFYNLNQSVDWYYDGTNYQNWTLTEYRTNFSGTFPWNSKPESAYYTTYTINSDISTLSLPSTDELPEEEIVKDETNFFYGSYMPKFDNGYTYIELLLNDGNTTTNLDVPASEVQQVTIWYSEETKDISFASTRVQMVIDINLENIESLSFTDCYYLEGIDLTRSNSKGNCVHEETFEGVNENCMIAVSKDWETTEEQSGFTGTYVKPFNYYIDYTILGVPNNYLEDTSFPTITNDEYADTDSYTQDFNLVEVYLKDGSIVTEFFNEVPTVDVDHIIVYYPQDTVKIKVPYQAVRISELIIDNFTSFEYMFTGCVLLTEIKGIEDWYTGSITNTSAMFAICSSLTALNLSNWDLENLTNAYMMFSDCTSLQTLNLSNWKTYNIEQREEMFERVPSDLDWCYDENDPNSYANFTLTEEQTGFSGTFPWNKQEEPDSPYYIEYSVKNDSPEFYNLQLGLTSEAEDQFITLDGKFKLCIPAIRLNGDWCYDHLFYKVEYTGHEVLSDKYEDIENLNLYDIISIRIYYPEETEGIRFFSTENESNLVRGVSYLEPERFNTLAEAFSFCSHLEEFNIKEPLFNPTNVFEANLMFEYCNNLKTLNLSGWDTSNIHMTDFMLNGIPEDINWYYYPDENPEAYANWTLTEEQTGFSGTFPWSKPYYIEYTVGGNDLVTYDHLFYSIIDYVDYIIAYGFGGVVFDSRRDDLFGKNKPSNICAIRCYYNAETHRLSFRGNNFINGVNYCRVPANCDLNDMFSNCERVEYLNLSNWEFDAIHSNNIGRMFYDDSPIRYLNLMNWGLMPRHLEELTDCFITADHDHDYENVNLPSYPTFVDYIPLQNSKYDMKPVGDILTPVKDLTGEGYTTEVILKNGDTMTLSDAINRRKYYREIHFIRQYYDPAQYGNGKITNIFGDNHDYVESILYLDTKNVTKLYGYFYFEMNTHIKYITPVLDFSNVAVMESLVGGTIPEGLVINIANSKPNEAIHGSNLLLSNANKDSMGALILPAGVFDLSKMSNTPYVNIIEVE